MAIGVTFFDLLCILVGLHGLHGCLAVLRALDRLPDWAVDGTLLSQPDAVEVGPGLEFTVSLAKQSLSQAPVLPQGLQTQSGVKQRLGHYEILLAVKRCYLIANVDLLAVLHLVQRLVQVGADVATSFHHPLPDCLALLQHVCTNALLKCLVVLLGIDQSP